MADMAGGYVSWVRRQATDSQILGMRERRDELRRINHELLGAGNEMAAVITELLQGFKDPTDITLHEALESWIAARERARTSNVDA